MLDPLLSDEDVREFQQLWLEEIGESIDESTARLYGERLVDFLHQIVTINERTQSSPVRSSRSVTE